MKKGKNSWTRLDASFIFQADSLKFTKLSLKHDSFSLEFSRSSYFFREYLQRILC